MDKKEIWKTTLANAMILFRKAYNFEDAFQQIDAQPGVDIAGIDSSVRVGLTSLENSLQLTHGVLYDEELEGLENATEMDIIKAIDAIHLNWREENWHRFLEKVIQEKENQYRQTQRIDFEEASEYLLFIKWYVVMSGKKIDYDKLQESFNEWAEKTANDIADYKLISENLLNHAGNIVSHLIEYREKLRRKLAEASEKEDLLNIAKLHLQITKVDKYCDPNKEARDVVEEQLKIFGWM